MSGFYQSLKSDRGTPSNMKSYSTIKKGHGVFIGKAFIINNDIELGVKFGVENIEHKEEQWTHFPIALGGTKHTLSVRHIDRDFYITSIALRRNINNFLDGSFEYSKKISKNSSNKFNLIEVQFVGEISKNKSIVFNHLTNTSDTLSNEYSLSIRHNY